MRACLAASLTLRLDRREYGNPHIYFDKTVDQNLSLAFQIVQGGVRTVFI